MIIPLRLIFALFRFRYKVGLTKEVHTISEKDSMDHDPGNLEPSH